MQITQAHNIPLYIVVEHLGGRYSHTSRQNELWYFSPFRPDEKTPSFKINPKTNKQPKERWHDFGLATHAKNKGTDIQGSGGDILDLWCDFHLLDRKKGLNEALTGLARFTNAPSQKAADYSQTLRAFQAEAKSQIEAKPPRYKILKMQSKIYPPGLKDELARRRISPKLANHYLKEGFIHPFLTSPCPYL